MRVSDVAAFDVHSGLKPLPIFGKEVRDGLGAAGGLSRVTRGGEATDEADSLSALVAREEKFHDELGEGYFLAQGRAMMALHVLMTRCDWRMEQRGELRFSLVLPAEDAKRLHKVAKSVALHTS
jgi:hypothetical protein